MSAPVILTLPAPPTVNNLFINIGRGRAMSKRYKSWRQTAGWEVKRQRPGRIIGPWEIDIALPAGLTGDLDNYAKPVCDLLVELGTVDDDRHCRRLSIAKAVTIGSVIVTLKAATQPQERDQ
jgi:crossover junction endodeoxyribonuclease RusA